MKRRTFYHLSLLLPYVILLMSGALTYLMEGTDIFASPEPPNLLMGALIFFAFGAIIWAPLYTWMVIVMLFWGRGRNDAEVRTLYLLSPVLLACAMGIPALLVGMPDSGMFLLWGVLSMNHLHFILRVFFENFSVEQSMMVGFMWMFMAAFCLVIGYALVGCMLLLERALLKQGVLLSEPDDALPSVIRVEQEPEQI